MWRRWFLGTAAAVSACITGASDPIMAQDAPSVIKLDAPSATDLDVPSATMSIDSTRARLGEPVMLRLQLRLSAGASPSVAAWSELPGGCVVSPLGETSRAEDGGGVITELRYELRCYELGSHVLPTPEVAIASSGGDTLIRTLLPIGVDIVGVRQDGDEELRDIKPPVAIPGGIPTWLVAVLAALAMVTLVALARWALNRRRPSARPTPPPLPTDFVSEFARIAAMGLLERGAYKIYYSLLSETLRRFLEEKAGIEAMERTTAEIASDMGGLFIDASCNRDIIDFLSAADLVKFARATPSLEQARRAPGTGAEIVRAVERILAPPLVDLAETASAASVAAEPTAV